MNARILPAFPASASIGRPLASAALVFLLLVLFRAPLAWLARGFSVPEYRQHMVYLVLFLGYLLFANRDLLAGRGLPAGRGRLAAAFPPCRFSLPACAALLFSLCAHGANAMTVRSNILGCVVMGAAVYGVAGFFMDRRQWRQSAAVVLLFFLCLPLSYHAETFVGFPLRLLSATIAQAVFSSLGAPVESAETVLRMENAFTHIDLPCSGVKSLFSITMLSLALSIAERYRPGLRWLAALAVSCLAAAVANVVRVILLVAAAGAPLSDFARESLHLPIGMAAFLAACLVAARAWKAFRPPRLEAGAARFRPHSGAAQIFLIGLLAAVVLVGAAADARPSPRRQQPLAAPESLPLTEKEAALFVRHGVTRYEKAPFSVAGQRGTAFLVLAASWRGHHHPEQCLQAQGHAIEDSRAIVLEGNSIVRLVTLKGSDTAVLYWFQAADGVTDDYASRVWRGMLAPGKPFVMNSIFIDRGRFADAPGLERTAAHFFHKSRMLLGENT